MKITKIKSTNRIEGIETIAVLEIMSDEKVEVSELPESIGGYTIGAGSIIRTPDGDFVVMGETEWGNWRTHGGGGGSELPEVTSSDHRKVLQVDYEGKWATGMKYPDESGIFDEGCILQVKNGDIRFSDAKYPDSADYDAEFDHDKVLKLDKNGNFVLSDTNTNFDMSADATIVGKWVDGRPVYQTTVHISSLPAATSAYYPIIGDYDSLPMVIDIRGVAIKDYTSSYGFYETETIPTQPYSSEGLKITVRATKSTDYPNRLCLNVGTNMDLSAYEGYITVLYVLPDDEE